MFSNKVSCIKCKSEITDFKFHLHLDSKQCVNNSFSKLETCPHCNLSLLNVVFDIPNHIRWCKENPKNKRFVHGKTINCTSCGVLFSLISHKDRKTTCSKKCSYTRTDDQKIEMSKIRKEFLSKNPDKHPWTNPDKQKSIPCENVKKYLLENNIEFIEEYRPLDERFFSIDIAFPHLKIGIEINGNQHYNKDGTLASYYQERHDLIRENGWKLIEVHYTKCFNLDSISKIFDFDLSEDSNLEINRIKNLLIKKDKETLQIRGQKIKNKTDEKWNKIKDTIFDHNINFQKFGWVSNVSLILNIPPQKVSNWMKRYQPEFYKSCFKRKTS